MSHIPIDKQLRASGLRRARAGEESHAVYLSYRGADIAVQVVEIPNVLDPVRVMILRAFAATFWETFPEFTLTCVRIAMCHFSEMIGATDAEVTQASLRLETVREW